MKLKEGLIINKIDDEYVLVDVGTIKPVFNGMIKLNKTSKEIVDLLKNEIQEEEVIATIANKYKISKKEIEIDIKNVINKLKVNHLLII